MSPAWIPVVITALIVLGVVGGSVMQMVLKEVLPLLRTMAQERQAVGGRSGTSPSHEALESIEKRLARVEAGQRKLEEESEFLQKLLAERTEEKRVRPPSDE